MISHVRVWWGTGAVVVGVGAAILAGAGVAAADIGDGSTSGRSSSSQQSHPSAAGKSASSARSSIGTAVVQRRLTATGAATGTRTLRINATRNLPSASVREERGSAAATTAKPKFVGEAVRSRLTAAVTRMAATINADLNVDFDNVDFDNAGFRTAVAANPIRPPRGAPKSIAVSPVAVTSDVTATPNATGNPSQPADPAAAPAVAVGPVANLTPPTQVSPEVRVSQLITAVRSSLAVPAATGPPASRPLATLVLNVLSSAGWTPRPEALATFPALAAWSAASAAAVAEAVSTAAVTPTSAAISAPTSNGVTGVRVGHSDLTIPYGAAGYTTSADWYFPTQADGSVQATGVIWLQHGFLADKSWYSALATQLARQTNSVVVAPNIPSFPPLFGSLFGGCTECTLNSVPLQEAVATMFLGDRAALNISANAAGFSGTLPEKFILTGHSAGGGFATAVGGFAIENGAADNLLGVVMFDGVSSNGTFAPAVTSLAAHGIPVYQIAAPPQPWNANGQTTNDLVALLPNQFVGVVLNNGSHVDSLIGGVPIIDFVAQLFVKWSPPGNTAAVYTLSAGWINDMYAGNSPGDPPPLYGLYGNPGQPIILGPAAAVVLGTPQVAVVNT